MSKPNVKTSKLVIPIIYGYTTPEIRRHDGCTKIGDTERDAEARIGEQTNTSDVEYRIEWTENAVFSGTIEIFRDHDFHKVLEAYGIERLRSINTGELTEWFRIEPKKAEEMLQDFRHRRITVDTDEILPYTLRDEQRNAVEMTVDYRNNNPEGEFLWNAKPRFGKTLCVYDLAKRMGAKKVLIVTNRPAIANSWYSDYMKFLGRQSGYFFVSSTDALKGKSMVIPYETYAADEKKRKEDNFDPMGMIYFLSLQDLKGSSFFGGELPKLREISIIKWDLLVIDEAHEGVDTYKTDTAFNHIKREFTLHLSGTPFKALANAKFRKEAIFNWTYAEEQQKKMELMGNPDNPYAVLPKLNMYTYQMSEIVADKIKQGVEILGETEEYAFDLGEFFRTKELASGVSFVYNDQVDMFLDALTRKEKYPFSSEELRDELKHTLWLLDRVDSVYALERKLNNHPIFKDYHVIAAVGDGSKGNEDVSGKAYDKVISAIEKYDKTITLSVRQLTTGVTIPEWTAVLILSNISSPSLYMQAAFRAQNPCLITTGSTDGAGNPEFRRKENAYVFDFDPARTLTVFEQFANNLNPNTSGGGGTVEQRQKNIHELLNFFPVIAEDENGDLVSLNPEQVLTIPRKIRSQEVVRRGFMSNFLFNIRNVFNIPKDALDIINKFTPVKEQKQHQSTDIVIASSDGFEVDDAGNVIATDEYTQEKANQIFGEKKYAEISEPIDELVENATTKDSVTKLAESISTMLNNTATNVIEDAQESYGDDMKKSDNNQITNQLREKADRIAHDLATDYQIQQNILDQEKKEAIEEAVEQLDTTNKSATEIEQAMEQIEKKIEDEFVEKKKTLRDETTQKIQNIMDQFEEDSKIETTRTVEEKKEQRRATDIMDDIRDRLRGFSRTIPSFIMAYSDKKTESDKPVDITLANFDEIVPDEVFKQVTSISLDEFRQLRDGFDYFDSEGKQQHFEGHVFDEVVFDDSIVEFVTLKKKLADYFDEKNTEDIFDYIPPQKTNQIFTPKDVVKKMVDYLEEENPGCFDMPDKTFIDPYMKSGLYITEIVKRLYQSKKIKELYPDKEDRLRHIFEKQVYGLAPTEIIYKIATNYILGFDEDVKITKHNFRQVDALPYAKDGTLQKVIDELYGDGDLSEEADNLIEVTASDDILSMVEKAGIEYIDLRYKKGPLWLIGGPELQGFTDSCNKYGYEFAYAPNGSKNTEGRPGWWLKRGGK